MSKIAAIFIFFSPFFVFSVEPDEILTDPVLEERAKEIGMQLRCMVCQNEDIENSNADIARDLRILVRDMIVNGESNKEILNFVHEKYGDFILFKPPIKSYTFLLWACPFLLFIIFMSLFFRRKN
tara:strand:+ start:6729 stop:7103 length:375 start_codon:yes stop_codon:yes gene_type:complete